MNKNISSALQGWVPNQLFMDNEEPLCHWVDMGDKEFSEPFFSDTINKKKSSTTAYRRFKSTSSLEMLDEWSGYMNHIAPTSLIFHVSRCGSTMISQLLELNKENIILSEVPFFDELLRWQHKTGSYSQQGSTDLFQSALAFYAARRNPLQKRLYIKTDSWHIFFYEQLRRLFPATPFILLYRRPDEVIRSHQKQRGMQAVPGLLEPELFGFNLEEILHTSLDEYMAMVLEKYYEAFLQINEKDPLAMLASYNEGAINIVQKIASASGYNIQPNELADMNERIKYHGKYPEQVFSEVVIQETVPGYMDKVFRLYEELEKKRF